jgi:hypothetical protein
MEAHQVLMILEILNKENNAMNFRDLSKISRADNEVEFKWIYVKMFNREDREGTNRKNKIT